MGRLRLVRAAAVGAALLAVVVAGCAGPGTAPPTPAATSSPAANTPSPQVTSSPPAETVAAAVVYGCDGAPVSAPEYYLLACGNAGWWLKGLSWSGWGSEKATATGQFWQRTCRPSCVEGGALPYQATVTAGGLTGGAYTTLHIVVPQHPDGALDFILDEKGAREKRTVG
ncbi:hypothetical protein ACIA8O_16000 [Kitasatospora sp. NPDC051853]|uniref:hypothetical protein n=1 Tax=Kitasatospora sp. NPDC051853 TaxID=3364058 RepID=UPI0037A263B5